MMKYECGRNAAAAMSVRDRSGCCIGELLCSALAEKTCQSVDQKQPADSIKRRTIFELQKYSMLQPAKAT